MSVSDLGIDQKALARELEILNDELYRNERPIVIELIERLQQARSADDYMQLQIKLIGRAQARQQMADELREAHAELKAQIAELVKRDPMPIEELKVLQRQL